ncbi:MAG: helicase C-terminal domain-containing protein, partial [Nitrospiraceae bacterium]
RTLRSFDYYLRETGLRALNPRTEVIESPFDYPRQGKIIVSKTAASPSANLDQFVRAMSPQLFDDLAAVEHGALVLFSSKAMMEQVVKALPDRLQPLVLVQGKRSRDQLLATHRKRVAQGKPSILMGVASLGEGLDLPGEQCQSVHIPKLPFAMPTNPVEEARAEAVTARRGNPFLALSVPATAMTMTQWVGRGIRTETDTATVVFYDPRLVSKTYGKQLLDGLPPFARSLRLPNGQTHDLASPP